MAIKAVDAALGGRTAEFTAYGDILNTNGTDIGGLIGQVYGADAQTRFNGIWSAHNADFVEYTQGLAAKDTAKQTDAVNKLTTVYIPQFSALIAGATGLPTATVTELTTMHITTTKAVVDDIAAKSYDKAATDLRAATAHMQKLADPVAEAIATQHSDMFPGDPKNKGVDFRVALDNLLQEHLYLATSATGDALAGNSAEFTPLGAALNANGTDLGSAIGGLFGPDAGTQFNAIWSAHNADFVEYTTGLATNDKTKQDDGVKQLTTVYIPQFSKFVSDASGLPLDAVTGLVTEHITTTKAVVDDQAAKKQPDAAKADRMAGQHMQKIGDPLAKAIVAKLPAKFS
ncbi:MAG: hypothetical protein QOJ93_1569 [Actinomycetota bacterium]|nr:hypothetical protein [Actinomycetota bacterium]